jgi:8-oxo-dGTP pyrophosphatase MutT (NUDIX family)
VTQRPRRRKPREETSAGGVVFRHAREGIVFLLIRDSYRNWGFPKGHLEEGEAPERAALREVAEETGLGALVLRSEIDVIEWQFRFRGRVIHKVCHFYLMETRQRRTKPQLEEGITACRWATFDQAEKMLAYDNAKTVLQHANAILAASQNGAQDAAPLDAA